ncbi:protein VASCULATURE COMPLEXITY AND CONNECTIVITY-like [Daucus carota subsp. sativus]
MATSQCKFPSSPAMPMGLTAAVALIIAQTLINITTGCLCCHSEQFRFNSRLIAAVFCSSMSWFTFSAAFLLFLIGAALNYKHGEESLYYGDYSCYVVKRGVFAIAAVLSLVTVALGILSYIKAERAKNMFDSWTPPAAPGQPGISMGQVQLPQQSGTAMGQAQIPQQRSQSAVDVYENTYSREQIV